MNALILFNIFGSYQSDITGRVVSTLINHGLDILDLSQSVNNGCLLMTLTCRMKNSSSNTPFPAIIHGILGKQGLQSSHQLITKKNEAVCERSAAITVLTLISSSLNADHLLQVINTLSTMGIEAIQVNTLSNPKKTNIKSTACFCVEMKLTGYKEAADQQLSKRLQALSHELQIDLVLQPDLNSRKQYCLAVFDMDSTLIKAEVIDLLADAAGVGDKVAAITEQAMRGELDFNDSFKQRLAMLKGLDESVLETIARQLPIMDGAEKLIRNLKATGFKTAIISGGFTYFAQYLKDKLGIDTIHANELNIQHSKVTGQVKGPIINGEKKAELLEQIATQEGVSLKQVIAVGDGANDLPMLSKAGLGIAFRAKPVVKKNARHAITVAGLDGILHILGFADSELF